VAREGRRADVVPSPAADYPVSMRVHVADHPLITHKLSVLRDVRTPSPVFRQLTEELVTLLAYEATRSVKVSPVEITTPVTKTMGVKISEPRPIVVPILRAGLGMLEGLVKLLPTAEVGFLGMVRDEETFEPTTYAERLPDDLSDRQCFAIDPMLATGGSLAAAIQFLFDRGAKDVTAICLLGTPEGVAAIEAMAGDRDVTLVLGALDERLNEKGYIVPGLGDAGDRLYGTV
jgi:uracil phosphoribosyltransferase